MIETYVPVCILRLYVIFYCEWKTSYESIERSVFGQEYTLEGTDWTVDGDFWEHRYEISGSSGSVASIAKAFFSWGDSYQIDISDGADEVLVLATVLAIDCVIEDSSSNH